MQHLRLNFWKLQSCSYSSAYSALTGPEYRNQANFVKSSRSSLQCLHSATFLGLSSVILTCFVIRKLQDQTRSTRRHWTSAKGRLAPAYLADSLRPTSEFVARRHLRSADTTTLLVPPTRRVTLGDRAFPVAAVRAWNSLLAQVRVASSLLSFRRQTKAHLFQLSYNWLLTTAIVFF